MYLTFLKVLIIFFNLPLTFSTLCTICSCYSSGIPAVSKVFNCTGKLIRNDSNDLNSILQRLSDGEEPDKLILSNNNITLDVDSDSIYNIDNLRALKTIKKLDLSLNKLEIFDIELFNKIPLIKLNLSHNLIDSFKETAFINDNNALIQLDLSYNRITSLNKTSFRYFPSLQFLNLSFNLITIINHQTFTNLNNLNFLQLNNNEIKGLNCGFSKSLKKLFVNNNQLSSFPQNLSVHSLRIDNNLLTDIKETDLNNANIFNILKSLNISGNKLSEFVEKQFIGLKSLDVSYNNFSKIPSSISHSNLPNLEKLIISGNPVKQLKFNSYIKLRHFIADDNNLLESIDEDAFYGLKTYEGDCLNISISFNRNLKSVNEKFLDNIEVCYLDLSYNYLNHTTPETIKFINGSFPKYGVNLQGNPFICDCKLQWMLDDLVQTLYESHSAFLGNLRCNSPREFFNMRMIHWYNWRTQVFCQNYGSDEPSEKIVIFENDETFLMPQNLPVVIRPRQSVLFLIIGSAVLLAIITIGSLTVSQKLLEKRRRQNRRL